MAEIEKLNEQWYSRPDVEVLHGEDQAADTWVLRASSIGGCPVGLAYSVVSQEPKTEFAGIMPQPPDEWLQGAMDESAALEQQALDLWIDEMKSQVGAEVTVYDHIDLRCELGLGSDIVAGTIDFPVAVNWPRGRPQDFTVEIKVVGADLFEQMKEAQRAPFHTLTGLPRKYMAQCGVYRWAIGNHVMLVVAEKAKGALTGRVSWSHYAGTGNADERYIPNVDDLRLMVEEVEQAVMTLRQDGKAQCPGGGDAKCKWANWCHVVEELDKDEQRAYEEYLIAKASAEEYAARFDSAKHELTAIVRAKGGRAVSQGGDKITWVEQHVEESTRTVKAHDRKFLKVTPNKEKANGK